MATFGQVGGGNLATFYPNIWSHWSFLSFPQIQTLFLSLTCSNKNKLFTFDEIYLR